MESYKKQLDEITALADAVVLQIPIDLIATDLIKASPRVCLVASSAMASASLRLQRWPMMTFHKVFKMLLFGLDESFEVGKEQSTHQPFTFVRNQ